MLQLLLGTKRFAHEMIDAAKQVVRLLIGDPHAVLRLLRQVLG